MIDTTEVGWDAGMIPRILYSTQQLDNTYGKNQNLEVTRDPSESTLRSSRVEMTRWWEENIHAPALDIDLPCRLIESSTPGHYHLYIDKPMSWEDYKKLLIVMGEVGILEMGFITAAIAREETLLRVRDKKEDPEPKLTWNFSYGQHIKLVVAGNPSVKGLVARNYSLVSQLS